MFMFSSLHAGNIFFNTSCDPQRKGAVLIPDVEIALAQQLLNTTMIHDKEEELRDVGVSPQGGLKKRQMCSHLIRRNQSSEK